MVYHSAQFKEAIYEQVARVVEDFRKTNSITILDLSVGDPDLPLDKNLEELLVKHIRSGAYTRYPPQYGHGSLKDAVVRWYVRKFGVQLTAKNVCILMGSKEGIAHLSLLINHQSEHVLVPDPAYPIYEKAARMAMATPYIMPLKQENGFLPDLSAIPEEILKNTKLMYLNYPNNPTGAVMTDSFFNESMTLARQHGFLICFDKAYEELEITPNKRYSVFNYPNGERHAVELYSFSKSHNCTAFRIGFAVGGEETIKMLNDIKAVYDSGHYVPIQLLAADALERDEIIASNNAVYRRRNEIVQSGLKEMGIRFMPRTSTFYFWCEVPGKFSDLSSFEFCMKLFRETGVMLTPGSGFGKYGEGYFRLSLTEKDEILEEAMGRMREWIRRK